MGLFGRKKKEETPFVTVIIAAAGASRRMGGENKQLIPISERSSWLRRRSIWRNMRRWAGSWALRS